MKGKNSATVTGDDCHRELQTIAKGSGIVFAGKIVGGVVSYAYLILLSRGLGAESFGIFVLVLTLVNIIGLISRWGLDIGIVRLVSQYRSSQAEARTAAMIQGAIQLVVGSGIVAALFTAICAEILAKYFLGDASEEYVRSIRLMALCIPFWSVMLTSLYATQGAKEMKYMVYAQNLCWPVLNTSLVLLFFVLGCGVTGVMAAHIGSVALVSLLSVSYLRSVFPDVHFRRYSTSDLLMIFRFSQPFMLVACLHYLLLWTDTLMLGYFRDAGEVGIYNAALKTALLTNMILFSFNSIFGPVISELHTTGQMEKLSQIFKIVTKWILVLSLPVVCIMILLARDIMLLFGPEFLPGWLALSILAFSQLVNAGVGSVGFLLMMTGKQKIMMFNSLVTFILNIVLNYFLIPVYGLYGAAFASALSLVFINIIMVVEVFREIGIHPFSHSYWRPLGLALLVLFIASLCRKIFLTAYPGIVSVVVCSVLFLSLFFGGYFFAVVNKEDAFIIESIRARVKRMSA